MTHRLSETIYAVEINFAIEKFNELLLEEKRDIYKGLQLKGQPFAAAAVKILEPLLSPNNKELTAYVNECLGICLNGYFHWPSDVTDRAIMMGRHFKENLKMLNGVPIIEHINMDQIRTA